MALRKICYRKSDGLVVVVKHTDWPFSTNETSGIFSVIQLDLTQEQLDDIDTNRIPLSNDVHIGCLKVDDPDSPNTIVRVTE